MVLIDRVKAALRHFIGLLAAAMRVAKRLPFRFWLGVVLSGASYGALMWITGGLWPPAEYRDRALMASVSMECGERRHAQRRILRARLHLADEDNPVLRISAFDDVFAKSQRQSLLAECQSLTYLFNFEPRELRYVRHKPGANGVERIKCPPPYRACYRLEGRAYEAARGHLTVHTGQAIARESYSSRSLEFALSARAPEAHVEVEIKLPDGMVPVTTIPSPHHVRSTAVTSLFYSASDRFGRTMPTHGGKQDRAIFPSIGLKVLYQSPLLARIETYASFLVSAVFGIGLTLTIEGLLAWHDARRRREAAGVSTAP